MPFSCLEKAFSRNSKQLSPFSLWLLIQTMALNKGCFLCLPVVLERAPCLPCALLYITYRTDPTGLCPSVTLMAFPDGQPLFSGETWPLKTTFWCLNAVLFLTPTTLPHKAFFRAFLSKLPHPLLCSGTFYVSYFGPMSHFCLLLLPLPFF